MTSPLMMRVISTMKEEHDRLDSFLRTYDAYGDGPKQDKPAEFVTPKVVVPTVNHGVFVLETTDLLKIMTARRDELAEELRGFNMLGEKINKPDTASS